MTLEQKYIYELSEKVESDYKNLISPEIKYAEYTIISPYQFAHLLYLYFEKQIDRKSFEYLVEHYDEYPQYILTYNEEEVLQILKEVIEKEEKLYNKFLETTLDEKEKIMGMFIGKVRKQLPRSTNMLLLSKAIRQYLGLSSLEEKNEDVIKKEYDRTEWFHYNKNYNVYLTLVLKSFFKLYHKNIKLTWRDLSIDNLTTEYQIIYNLFYKTIVVKDKIVFVKTKWYYSCINSAIFMYDNIQTRYDEYHNLFTMWKETKDLHTEYLLEDALTNLMYQFSLYNTLRINHSK